MPHRSAHRFLTVRATRLANGLQGPLPRWIFIPFAILPFANGWVYLSRDPLEFSTPIFAAAQDQARPVADLVGVDPMRVWGMVSVLCALIVCVGLIRYSTPVTAVGLIVAGTFYAYWAGLLMFQAIADPRVPPSGANFLMFVTTIYLFALLVIVATWPFRPAGERRRGSGRE